MNEIAAAIPEAGRVIRERRQEERGDILPHIEMGDLIRWIGSLSAVAATSGPLAVTASGEIRNFLNRLEAHFEVGDQDIDELIATSFLESLHLTGIQFQRIRAQLPPKMSAWMVLTGD